MISPKENWLKDLWKNRGHMSKTWKAVMMTSIVAAPLMSFLRDPAMWQMNNMICWSSGSLLSFVLMWIFW